MFKNNAPFINCISKINGAQINNAEDLDVVMSVCIFLEYCKNYRKTTGITTVCGIITEMSQVPLILNLLNTR